jgi:hypothetical protein
LIANNNSQLGEGRDRQNFDASPRENSPPTVAINNLIGGGVQPGNPADNSILSGHSLDDSTSIQNRHTQQQILDSIQASLGQSGSNYRLTDLLSRYRGDLLNSDQLNLLAQNRVSAGRDLLRPERRQQRRHFEPLHSSRENSPDSQGVIIASGRGARRNQRASRAGAGPLESDEDDLLQDLDESRQDDLDDDDEELAVDEIDPETGDDNAIRSSASSPPLASYDNRAQGIGVRFAA